MNAGAARKPWLLERAERSPHAACLIWNKRTRTFAELAECVEALARRLAGLGIREGNRVAVLAPPSIGFVEIFHAVHRLAAVLVPLPPKATVNELARMFERAVPQAVVFADELRVKVGDALAPANRRPILWAADFHRDLCGNDSPPAEGALTEARMQSDALHSIVFTSGTAGACKGVMLSNANQEASARASTARLEVGERDRWLACMPMHHVGGISILVRNVIAGAAVVLHPRFDADAVDRALREDGITMISLVPTMLARLIEVARGRPYSGDLRVVLTGGAPLDADLASRARALGLPIVPTYGLTEAASQVCTAPPGHVPAAGDGHSAAGWSGFPLAGTTAEIAEPGKDGVGEILVQAPTVTAGYVGDPEATRTLLRNGRLHSGDLGRLCADGSLVVECRRSDLIISGGENVYPGEVEAALRTHPEVAQVCVYGLPDPQWGQAVHAAVVLREPRHDRGYAKTDTIAERLRKHCGTTLSGFKIPRRFCFLESLPQTAGGKVARDSVARAAAEAASETETKGED